MKPETFLKKFEKLKNDNNKWQLVMDNQDSGVIVFLNNGDTFISFPDEDSECRRFQQYIGNSYGVVMLLKLLKIRCEHV